MAQTVLDGQSLGAFLVRQAWKWGESPATMAHRIGLEWSIWARDLDRSVGDRAIENISHATNLTQTEVSSMTLLHVLESAGVPTQRNGFQRWLTPVGIYHRKRLRYGQLYCPECLFAGRNHLPLNWRLGSSWVCTIHSRILRDSCDLCDMPFAPYRHDALMIARCDRCTGPLFRSHAQTAPPEECLLQVRVRLLWEAALEGRNAPLVAFHDALTETATRDPSFRGAGEPWTYWRTTERRSLLVKVASSILATCESLKGESVSTVVRKVGKPGPRRCNSLPLESAARAEALIALAERINFPRRPKAKIGKSA